MIKEERQNFILDLLDKNKIIRVSEITNQINVTDMTIRRDLKDLEEEGFLIRIHGGAKITENDDKSQSELSHLEKMNINLEEKEEIAQKIASFISDGDTIFLGAGTTIELVYDYLNIERAKIITNSIHIFNRFKDDRRFELILIGGAYREISGAFVGTIANDFVRNINVEKSFIGVNGIFNEAIYNSSENEGVTQQLMLNNSKKCFIVADHTKFEMKDFYQFYSLNDIDCLITDSNINNEIFEKYTNIVKVIK